MVVQADPAVEVACRVAGRYERQLGLEPGSFLSIAWIGARAGERCCPSTADSERRAYMFRGADYAVRAAIRDGELDGSRRLGDGRRVRPCSLQRGVDRSGRVRREDEGSDWQPPARDEADAAARLDAATLLGQLAEELGPRAALIVKRVDVEGRKQREVAAELGISAARVSQLLAQARRFVRERESAAKAGRPATSRRRRPRRSEQEATPARPPAGRQAAALPLSPGTEPTVRAG